MLWWLEKKLTFHPDDVAYSDISSFLFEETFVPCSSGTVGLYWKDNRSNVKESPSPVVLFFHGNTGNVTFAAKYYRVFQRLNISFLVVEYPGYGKTTVATNRDAPDEKALYESAAVAVDFLVTKENIPSEQITVYGLSLGGVPAVEAASTFTVKNVILECTFTDSWDMASFKFPLVPWRWLISNRYNNDKKLGGITAPLLLLHGEKDQTVPVSLAHKLYAASASLKKQLVIIPEAGHANIMETMAQKFDDRLTDFLSLG